EGKGAEGARGRESGKGNAECGMREALTLKELRKHIKRLVNFAEAGDGEKIREELKRVVPEYGPQITQIDAD
ncbi:MAG TPA: hypothetical protein HPP59_06925, partial [Deltaproteobacteria bacterium]|nr:hypothetical protein [Deltaproteobacteria bacterium]